MPPPGRGGRLEGGRPAILPSFFFSCSSSCNYFSFSCSCALLPPQPSPLLAGHVSRTHTNTHTRARTLRPDLPLVPTRPRTGALSPISFAEGGRGGRTSSSRGRSPQTEIGAPFFAPIAAGGGGGAKPTSERSKQRERERERERARFETMGNVKSKQAGPSKKALTSCYKDCTSLVKERKCAPILVRLAWWVVNRFWALRMPFR